MSPKLINVVIKLNLQYYLYSLYRLLQQDHMYLFYHYNHRVQSHLLYIFIYFLNLIKLGRDQGLLLEFRCAELCRIALNCTKIVRNCAQQCRLQHNCTEWEKFRGIARNYRSHKNHFTLGKPGQDAFCFYYLNSFVFLSKQDLTICKLGYLFILFHLNCFYREKKDKRQKARNNFYLVKLGSTVKST